MKKEVLLLVLFILIIPFISARDNEWTCSPIPDSYNWDGSESMCGQYCAQATNQGDCQNLFTQCGGQNLYSCNGPSPGASSDAQGDMYCDWLWDSSVGSCVYQTDWCSNYYGGQLGTGLSGEFFCEPQSETGWCNSIVLNPIPILCNTGDIYRHIGYCLESTNPGFAPHLTAEEACYRMQRPTGTPNNFRYSLELLFGYFPISGGNCVESCVPDVNYQSITVNSLCEFTSQTSCPFEIFNNSCNGDIITYYDCSGTGNGYTTTDYNCSLYPNLLCGSNCGLNDDPDDPTGVGNYDTENRCVFEDNLCITNAGGYGQCGTELKDLDTFWRIDYGTNTINYCKIGETLPPGFNNCNNIDWLRSGESVSHGDYYNNDPQYINPTYNPDGSNGCCGDDAGEYVITGNGMTRCCMSSSSGLNAVGDCSLSSGDCVDNDGDGYYVPTVVGASCGPFDCDDDTSGDPNGCPTAPQGCNGMGIDNTCAICINPGIFYGEICTDGVDNDCNGLTDCQDGACVGLPICTNASGTCDGIWDGSDPLTSGYCDGGNLSQCQAAPLGYLPACDGNCNCVYYNPNTNTTGYVLIKYGPCNPLQGDIGQATDTYYYYSYEGDTSPFVENKPRNCFAFDEKEPGFGLISVIVTFLAIISFYTFRKLSSKF